MPFAYGEAAPIYEQLVRRLRDQILAGVLVPGEKLPSVRQLAGELTINPNTISRAYRVLEQEGWVLSVPGKGVFVREGSLANHAHRQQLLSRLDSLVQELEAAGMTREDIADYLKGAEDHA